MPRFVIQQHSRGSDIHWDLMIERQGVLATWQVPLEPTRWVDEQTGCERIFDHRLHYLTYQGPLTNDRGAVQIVARGTYHPHCITENCWRIDLAGDTINLAVKLTRLQADHWSLIITGQETTP